MGAARLKRFLLFKKKRKKEQIAATGNNTTRAGRVIPNKLAR